MHFGAVAGEEACCSVPSVSWSGAACIFVFLFFCFVAHPPFTSPCPDPVSRNLILRASLEQKKQFRLYQFEPSEPNFGLVKRGSVYQLKVNVRTSGSDLSRFRLAGKPVRAPDLVASELENEAALDDVRKASSMTSLDVRVSSTKLIPGLKGSLLLELEAKSIGPFAFQFTIISEMHLYTITVRGHCLSHSDFGALAALSRLEGKSALGEGVAYVKMIESAAVVSAGPESEAFLDAGDAEEDNTSDHDEIKVAKEGIKPLMRDAIDGLYANLEMEDVKVG